MAKQIEVIVQPTGEVKIDAVGFKGADCEKATAFLEKALGQTTSKQKKPEFHARAKNVQKIGG
jgi:hypothetical protein